MSKQENRKTDEREGVEDPAAGIRSGAAHPNIPYTKLTDAQKALVDSESIAKRYGAALAGLALERLARDPSGVVRIAVVKNGGWDPESFAEDADRHVRAAVAEAGYCLDLLAEDEDPAVRKAVAKSAAATPDLLAELAGDPSSQVRMELVKRDFALDALFFDEDREVRAAASRRLIATGYPGDPSAWAKAHRESAMSASKAPSAAVPQDGKPASSGEDQMRISHGNASMWGGRR